MSPTSFNVIITKIDIYTIPNIKLTNIYHPKLTIKLSSSK